MPCTDHSSHPDDDLTPPKPKSLYGTTLEGDMMPSYLTGAFRLCISAAGIKLGLFFSFPFPFLPFFVQSAPCRVLPPKAQTRFLFLLVRLDNSPGAQTPSAAAAESVRSLYIAHSTEPVIMIGLSPGRQVRGWAS
ncbi:unnamed protein product [Penicillium camemberti]|uniref:Str. FM013 n=1 Tax=Penicillium camemberti (strain FM 013) TaxID=1429867 RepID=A0A0G4PEF1_PENC3|nr:unnamed protein product [Penicillium camemberti]